jgi:voltage-gated potassium channel
MQQNPLERKHLGADSLGGWRLAVYVVIFEADTRWGKTFDVGLIVAIMLSVLAVIAESVSGVRADYGTILYVAEWVFTVGFTIEYILRLACVGRPLRYAFSFFGIVDLLAVLPTYLSLVLPSAQALLVVRILRVLRVFRVLKLVHYVSEANVLMAAMRSSRRKVTIFMTTVLTLVVILGSTMYVIEGGVNGFTSIPESVYWAVMTLTTVGYGDIVPTTGLGKALASLVSVIGYAIIAVPTGIVTAEVTLAGMQARREGGRKCPSCAVANHESDAVFCKFCGTSLGTSSPGEAP